MLRESTQNSQTAVTPKVNVWCRIMHDKIIKPFFLLKNHLRLKFVLKFFHRIFGIIATRVSFITYFLAEWCTISLRPGRPAIMNKTFLDCWIERDGPIPRLPCFPYITTLDFFVWLCKRYDLPNQSLRDC